VELACSFRAPKPDTYRIPLAVSGSKSVPLGLIVGLSASIERYEVLFEWTRSLHLGPGRHFLCLRRIIESFAFNSFIGQIVRRLVFSSSEGSFRPGKEACAYGLLELQKRDKLDARAIARLYVTCGLGLSEADEVLQNWQI
jgi:hypothetical protein